MEKLIIANWKMSPQNLVQAQELFEGFGNAAKNLEGIEVVICPPFVYLAPFGNSVSRRESVLQLGAQDVFWENPPMGGPFTGEISIAMLKNLGVKYVLVGHSERRYILGEPDEFVNKKIKACLADGLIPVLLIGERAGDKKEEIIIHQLSQDLRDLNQEEISKIIFVYEPVWAISTGPGAKPDTPENALESVKFIMKFIFENWKLKIENCLYGGSVNEKNVADFLKYPEIKGAVVGGASLRKEEFIQMIRLIS